MASNKEVLLRLNNVKTYFPIQKGVFRRITGHVRAVDGVSFSLFKGETLGLVGESGCGKTTLGKSILRLREISHGEIFYNFSGKERDLGKLSAKEMMQARKKMQIVFQDPYSSLNPAFTIFGSLQDPLKNFGVKSRAERRRIIGDLLEAVNLRREHMDRYPQEFSGGQRQRIGIARALSLEPELIICDEPVSALDVSIQAQVLNLLKSLKEERGLTYIFISHDLSVVEYISDRIAVMYLGQIVELAEAKDLFTNALHPYTRALLSAIPVADLDHKVKRIILEGNVPSPIDPPSGCRFHPRCPTAQSICKKKEPNLKKYMIDGQEHQVACHLVKNGEFCRKEP